MISINVKWRQDWEFLECAEIGSKRDKLDKPMWHEFNTEDILFHRRDYCIKLFSNGTPVVIKENETYICNTDGLFNQYKSSGRAVKRLSDCPPSTKPVIDAGFIGEVTT